MVVSSNVEFFNQQPKEKRPVAGSKRAVELGVRVRATVSARWQIAVVLAKFVSWLAMYHKTLNLFHCQIIREREGEALTVQTYGKRSRQSARMI
jgi:hypothetical protein